MAAEVRVVGPSGKQGDSGPVPVWLRCRVYFPLVRVYGPVLHVLWFRCRFAVRIVR